MTLAEYQAQATTTDLFKKATSVTDPAFVAKILGLVGEAGEVADKFKKIIRDKAGLLDESSIQELTKELGDVLWYVSMLAHYMDVPLEEVARVNIEKLSSRQDRGKLHGAGDNR